MLDSRRRPPSGPLGSPGMTAGFEAAVLMEAPLMERLALRCRARSLNFDVGSQHATRDLPSCI
jgi:hypothetical protein